MKTALRAEMLEKRLSLSRAAVQEKSAAMGEKLYAHPAFREAQTLLLYLPIKNEPDTHPVLEKSLQEGKKVGVPVSNFETREIIPSRVLNPREELQHTQYGILEPSERYVRVMEVQQLDLVLVPGIAFDARGHRLGYGQGFYDRFLSTLPEKTVLMALAYEQQLVDALPVEAHDRRVHYLVTEQRVIRASR